MLGCHRMSCGRYRDIWVGAFVPSCLPVNHLIISSPFFPHPAPSPRLSLACLLNLIPRPRAWDAPTEWRSAVAGSVPTCLLPIMPCRSLAPARSLLPLPPRHGHDAIAAVPHPPACFVIAPRRPSRLRVIPSPPDAPPLLVVERGGATGRLRDVRLPSPCLLACPMPSPRLGRFGSRPSHLIISCVLAFFHAPTEDACGAVRSLCLLPRLSVSIIFKMFPRQCFKTMRLFGMARLCGYRPIPVPPRRSRTDCLRPLRRQSSVLCVVVRLPAPRFSPRSPDTIDGAEATLRVAPLLAWRDDGRSVRSRRVRHAFVQLLAPCAPRIARRRAAPRIAAAYPFPHGASARPFPSCPHCPIAPPNRHGERGAGRGGLLTRHS